MSKRKKKASSVMPMSITVGLFLGIGLGAIMDQLLVVMILCILAGAAVGWRIDSKAGIRYGKHK